MYSLYIYIYLSIYICIYIYIYLSTHTKTCISNPLICSDRYVATRSQHAGPRFRPPVPCRGLHHPCRQRPGSSVHCPLCTASWIQVPGGRWGSAVAELRAEFQLLVHVMLLCGRLGRGRWSSAAGPHPETTQGTQLSWPNNMVNGSWLNRRAM